MAKLEDKQVAKIEKWAKNISTRLLRDLKKTLDKEQLPTGTRLAKRLLTNGLKGAAPVKKATRKTARKTTRKAAKPTRRAKREVEDVIEDEDED
jgi:hypothetical protein